MACDINTGRLEACKDSIGGIRNIYIGNYDAAFFDGLTEDGTSVTALTAPITVYKFELRGDSNTFEETNENSRDNGTSFWTQSGAIVLKHQDAATQAVVKLLSYGRPYIIVEDYNGNYRLAGAQNGCEVTSNTSTGGAMGDLNGYNLSFEGREKSPSFFVTSSLMGDAAGFVISTDTITPN